VSSHLFRISSSQKSLIFPNAFQIINIKKHKTIFLPVVSQGYETWSVTLMEERRLRSFEKIRLCQLAKKFLASKGE
jgi:hypothetical protein